MRNFGENFSVYISPVSLTRWIILSSLWALKILCAVHFTSWRESWFSEVLKSHFIVGGKTGKYCSRNLNHNPSSLHSPPCHPLWWDDALRWLLEVNRTFCPCALATEELQFFSGAKKWWPREIFSNMIPQSHALCLYIEPPQGILGACSGLGERRI